MQAFNGAGDTTTPLWVNIGVFWCFQIPVALWLSQGSPQLGTLGVFWAATLAYSVNAMVGVLLFKKGRWKLKSI